MESATEDNKIIIEQEGNDETQACICCWNFNNVWI